MLWRAVGRLTKKSAPVTRRFDSLTVDSAAIRRELDWSPPFTLGEGLRDKAAWYLRQGA